MRTGSNRATRRQAACPRRTEGNSRPATTAPCRARSYTSPTKALSILLEIRTPNDEKASPPSISCRGIVRSIDNSNFCARNFGGNWEEIRPRAWAPVGLGLPKNWPGLSQQDPHHLDTPCGQPRHSTIAGEFGKSLRLGSTIPVLPSNCGCRLNTTTVVTTTLGYPVPYRETPSMTTSFHTTVMAGGTSRVGALETLNM